MYSTQQVSLRADGGDGCCGIALLELQGSDGGLLAFGLARQMLQSGRYVQPSGKIWKSDLQLAVSTDIAGASA